MRREELAADRSFIAAASPGPWIPEAVSEGRFVTVRDADGQVVLWEGDPADAAFITRARERWPAALDAWEEVRNQLEALRSEIDRYPSVAALVEDLNALRREEERLRAVRASLEREVGDLRRQEAVLNAELGEAHREAHAMRHHSTDSGGAA